MNLSHHTQSPSATVCDIKAAGWVAWLPQSIQPLVLLARWDRPIGIYLLFLPSVWGLIIGAQGMPPLSVLTLYAIGAVLMRGAGCTINDIFDRTLDATVARTASRPLPARLITLHGAWLWLAFQLLCALIILLSLPVEVWIWAIAVLPLVLLYPFMKRVTWWPQLWLGLTFNWGIFLGAETMGGGSSAMMIFLYIGAVVWTIGYDTIYAVQDIVDDEAVGIKSTARLFGSHTRAAVICLYIFAIAMWSGAGYVAGLGVLFTIGIISIAILFGWQIYLWQTRSPQAAFVHNKWVGLALALTLLAGYSAT